MFLGIPQSLVLSIIISAALSLNVSHATTITLRGDEWFPVTGKPNSKKPGYLIEIVDTIFQKAGYTVDYQTLPWDQSIALVRQGECDCVAGTTKRAAPDLIFPEEDLGMNATTFYVAKGSQWQYRNINSLEGVRLGVIAGYTYGEPLDTYIKNNITNTDLIKIATSDTPLSENLKKLHMSEIDAIPENDIVMTYKLNELTLNNDDVIAAGTLADLDPLYIGCSPIRKTSYKYVDLITKGIIELRKNGKLDEILNKYKLADWKKPGKAIEMQSD